MSEAIASKAERLAAYNANIAAAEKDPSLSPETGKPLSKMNAARFGAGFLVFGVLWMSGLGIVSAVLLPMHYKTIPGVNADALVGIVNAFTAVASLVANLMFGSFSDRSRSRFGRRTPWILFGAVLGGVTLFLTGTTLSVPALTGTIMTMGVATANSILLVSFARSRLADGVPPLTAALEAASTRLRPVLMTAFAMIAGMLPMALGVGEGAEQNAPLGRAVIGGLAFATASTLLFVPLIFASVHLRLARRHLLRHPAPA